MENDVPIQEIQPAYIALVSLLYRLFGCYERGGSLAMHLSGEYIGLWTSTKKEIGMKSHPINPWGSDQGLSGNPN
jgi:hypothetical protein